MKRKILNTFTVWYPTRSLYRAELKKDRYNDDSRTREENAQLFYDEVLNPALMASGNRWTEDVQMRIANRVYSSDYGTGYERGNGNQASGDGWKYRGHGQLQLTGKGIIVGKSLSGSNWSKEGFADYVRSHYQAVGLTVEQAEQLYQRIVADPTVLDTDPNLSARSAAWYWATYNKNTRADQLNESDSTAPNVVIVNGNFQYLGGNQFTDLITKGIATYEGSFVERWRNWRDNITVSLTGGNPHENLQTTLKSLGFNTQSGPTYQQQFGISLTKRIPVSIVSSHALVANSLASSADSASYLQNLINQAKTDLGFTEEDNIMLIADLPADVPSATASTVLIAKAPTDTTKPHQRVAGVCIEVAEGKHDIHPETDANSYYANFEGKSDGWTINLATAKVQILQAPKHGTLASIATLMSMADASGYRYLANPDYVGQDYFVLLVTDDQQHEVKLQYYLSVENPEETVPPYHQTPKECLAMFWKISTGPSLNDLAWNYTLGIPTVPVNYATLLGTTLTQTTGTGLNAKITLV